MDYFTAHWGYPVVALVAVLVLAAHERGLRAINSRSTRTHAVRRRRRLWLSYAGIALLTLSIVSPMQYWAMEYFWVHMLQHVTVMIAAPALYVAGAPALPLIFALPVGLRRRVLKSIFLRPTRHPLRAFCSVALSPAVGIIVFNVVMVAWMLPSLFNPIMARPELHIGLMLTTFFISGLLFWIQFIPSPPHAPKMSPIGQAGALLITNLIMTIIAVSISFFVSVPSYDFGAAMAGMSHMGSMAPTTLDPMADQRIGAAILWVCGDFWCFPALVIVLRRAMNDDESSSLVDRLLRGQRGISAEEFEAARART